MYKFFVVVSDYLLPLWVQFQLSQFLNCKIPIPKTTRRWLPPEEVTSPVQGVSLSHLNYIPAQFMQTEHMKTVTMKVVSMQKEYVKSQMKIIKLDLGMESGFLLRGKQQLKLRRPLGILPISKFSLQEPPSFTSTNISEDEGPNLYSNNKNSNSVYKY